MKLLAIDTTEDACSAALLVDGEVRSRFEIAPRRHGELILSMMDALLEEGGLGLAQLDALAFGRGPGSFTGVRIATAVVQGAAFAADLPVVPVSTLLALAERARREHGAPRVLAALDARMGEVYWAACRLEDERATMRLDGAEGIFAPGRVPTPEHERWVGAGSGWGSYGPQLEGRSGGRITETRPGLRIHAHDIAVLGARGFAAGLAVPAERALPVYLRDEVAWKKPPGS